MNPLHRTQAALPAEFPPALAALFLAAATWSGPAPAAQPPPTRSIAAILAASAPSDWRELAAEDTLYLDLDRGRVIIELAPQHLDRNITVVGRVVQGMELLSTLPRGPAPMGFYESAAQRTAIRKLRLMADVPPAERTALQVIRTDTPTFTELVESRRNRVDDWNKVPAGYIEPCNVQLPVRRP